MEKLGVIGGMGPEATSYYYDQVVRHTQAARDQEHLDMVLISCASMPDRTRAIQTGEADELMRSMRSCTALLEGAGCAHIAIPCNTSHYFFDQIQASTSVPIIHMPREAARYAVAGAVAGRCGFDPAASSQNFPHGVQSIGIMATDGTVSSGVYGDACERAGARAVYPPHELQAAVMSIIYDDVKAGRAPNLDAFARVLDWFCTEARCDRVILACTELSVISQYREMPAEVLDAMDVLVRESIVRSGAPYRA